MSHITAINIEIKDLEALDAACAELNANLKRNKSTYNWFGRSVGDYPLPPGFTEDMLGKCEHAIGLPGVNYEIGVCKNPVKPGSYTLLYDFYGYDNTGHGHDGMRLQKHFGDGLAKLKQLYGLHLTQRNLQRRGIAFTRKTTVKADGTHITLQAHH
jgi:hypothetical protein